ncbi:M10 family metallopeptidase C-terminal domain-containing protein [Roseomonas sp. PWR1]|uniref:M10 family metallopeptidase C-terminal domain-containing protein n=1 Tax=Roseomonas nitratireducens TaxID=2820810 RepID=A0ABS4AP79_9PROT|nr:M64 family metallopeptidase [Neoroseomonas nitratireducens]MBP0462387.1 M10 family metallopeptidase C-terminal domain-containing protein [Neoroseomonas nitratireducens]
MAGFTTVQDSGPSANRIDMVFVGDGYTSGEIATTYAAHVQALLTYIFDGTLLTEPFGRYRNFFNIHRVEVVSAESGADDPGAGVYRNTALGASYRWDGVTDRLLYISDAAANAAVAATFAGTGITAEMRFATVNSATYGGGGGNWAVYAGGNSFAREVALHEVGHSFAQLADEYWFSGTYTGGEPFARNVTTDPTGAKWAEWIGYNQPGLGVIGAYEGGYYNATGIWRPSLDSKMRSLDRPFDVVAREEFIRGFYALVDPIDSHTPNAGTQTNRTSLTVDVIDPAVIRVDWTVNGTTFAGAGETFDLRDRRFGFGTFTVTALAQDPTDWVRGDRSALQESVTWTVVNDYERYGTAAANRLDGTANPNAIFGLGGHDTLDGLAGADTLAGGPGDDLYVVDQAGDRVVEAAGAGTDTVRTTLALYTLGATLEHLVAGDGTPHRFNGNAAANRLTGGGGADTLSGGAGADTLDGGGGIDRLSGGGDDDWYVLTPGDIVAEGAGGGRDTVTIGAGTSYALAAEVEALRMTAGTIVFGLGNTGANTMVGNANGNVLNGAGGADSIAGEGGADVLIGGEGADTLRGGAAGDVFRFDAAADSGPAAPDLIADFAFRAGEVDRISLSRIDARAGTAGDEAFTFIGTNAFTGVQGQLRAEAVTPGVRWRIEPDVNGDRAADLVLLVDSATAPVAGWFIL